MGHHAYPDWRGLIVTQTLYRPCETYALQRKLEKPSPLFLGIADHNVGLNDRLVEISLFTHGGVCKGAEETKQQGMEHDAQLLQTLLPLPDKAPTKADQPPYTTPMYTPPPFPRPYSCVFFAWYSKPSDAAKSCGGTSCASQGKPLSTLPQDPKEGVKCLETRCPTIVAYNVHLKRKKYATASIPIVIFFFYQSTNQMWSDFS